MSTFVLLHILFSYFSVSTIKELAWEDVFEKYGSNCPNFLAMVDYLLTIPSSCRCRYRFLEVGTHKITLPLSSIVVLQSYLFTYQIQILCCRVKMVKHDWRSRLGETNISDSMLVYMESPSIKDFSPSDAIQKWYISGKRF